MELTRMDTVSVPQSWINGLIGMLGSLMFWTYRKLDRKVEKINDNYMTRKEIEELLAKRDLRVEQMHADNMTNFREQRSELQGINTKLFDLSGRIQK